MSGQAWAHVIAVSGSVLALLGVVVGGLLAARAQSRHWRFSEQADACAAFLAAYAGVYLAHVEAVRSGTAATAQHTSDFVDWAQFNEALEALNIRADAEIAQAAHDLDASLWRVGRELLRRPISLTEWAAQRRALDEAKLTFVNVCRSRLVRGAGRLNTLSGRPADDDPIWAAP
ncbi:hypothetical protein LWF15_03460 [Kineosporia rhizophila]|uniref:hypothetical protein n=1 Tax=Kineosporia rhizophila TaxID=84633 RepID=UPI001E442255|nr:hypothetical protein [Kineosporia rhizophila]MCE0534555.1 hypothetical protein [Kineosporia rhizophila]